MSRFLLLFVLFFTFSLLDFGVAHAQKKGQSYSNKHRPIRMTRAKQKVICPIFEESGYPYQGFGIKVGDPLAFTYKFYANPKFGFVLDFGSAASGLYSKKHREDFNGYLVTDTTQAGDNSGFTYRSHEVINEYTAEAKLLYHVEADKLFPGLQAYIGGGVQFRRLGIKYKYRYVYNFGQLINDDFEEEKNSIGPTIAAGLEYSYFSLPVSAFIEVELFSDVVADEPWTKLQGGIGIRYVF